MDYFWHLLLNIFVRITLKVVPKQLSIHLNLVDLLMPCRYHFCCWLDPFFSKYVFIKLYFFFCYLDFHSQSFTNHRTTTSTRFTDTYPLAGRLLQRSHLCTYLAAGLKPGTFGFQAQVTEHEPLTTRLYLFLVK